MKPCVRCCHALVTTLPRMNSPLETRQWAQQEELRWTNRYARLGEAFHTALPAQPLPAPHWVATSDSAARSLGWPADWWKREADALQVFSGNALWPGMQPVATVYSGHQFGIWAGQLGDGRALLLGEVETPAERASRSSSRAAAARPTRAWATAARCCARRSANSSAPRPCMRSASPPRARCCVTGSPLPVRREEIESAAVVTRLAPSFVRFGHFEHFSHHDLHAELRTLANFVIEHHYPECRESPSPYAALLDAVTRRTALLMAQWQAVGFCHGVMNTDNMSILGLTIDYGPFGFLDVFDPRHICNHSDHQGRYAYARQPHVAFWNLHALAQAMLPLLGDQDEALRRAFCLPDGAPGGAGLAHVSQAGACLHAGW